MTHWPWGTGADKALKVRVTESRPLARTLHLEGRLDHDTAAVLDSELDKLARAPVNVLVLDLERLEYISSAGLRSIFGAQKTLAQRSGRVVLVNAQPQIKKVFEIVRAADLGVLFVSIGELDRYLDAMQRKVIDGT
jgi:anti-anti-sigma factor